MVARDGIEPPTPAFSGLDSSIANPFKARDLKHSDGFNSPLFWDSNGTKEWDNNSGRSNLPSLSIIPLPFRTNIHRLNIQQVSPDSHDPIPARPSRRQTPELRRPRGNRNSTSRKSYVNIQVRPIRQSENAVQSRKSSPVATWPVGKSRWYRPATPGIRRALLRGTNGTGERRRGGRS